MMKKHLHSLVIILLIVVFVGPVHADVSPGDVIDKTNWQKAENLLPKETLEWVKKGDLVLNIEKLNYDPLEYEKALVSETFNENMKKYKLVEDKIVEASTGNKPAHITGLPFPEYFPNADESDPNAAIKIMINREYLQLSQGNLRFPYHFLWIDKKGFDREAKGTYYQSPLDGYAGSKNMENPEDIQRYQLFVFHTPFDIAGTAQMTWRYRTFTADTNFAFLPSIRRVRRLTPANRSDSILGSDFVYDDAWGYDGKVSDYTWKILRKQEALMAFLKKDPEALEPTGTPGEWRTTANIKPVVYGYQKENNTGSSWAPTNLVWAKRPVYVLEAQSKDPYYNLGKQYVWIDSETLVGLIKIMHDRSGEYWKSVLISQNAFESPDKKVKLMSMTTQQIIDDRTGHCTIIEDMSPRNLWVYYAKEDVNKFSLGGFSKFCK